MSLLKSIVAGTSFRNICGFSSVGKGLEDSDGESLISWVAIDMIEVVGSCNDLGRGLDDGVGLEVLSELGVDGGSKAINQGSVGSGDLSSLWSSNHCVNKKDML